MSHYELATLRRRVRALEQQLAELQAENERLKKRVKIAYVFLPAKIGSPEYGTKC